MFYINIAGITILSFFTLFILSKKPFLKSDLILLFITITEIIYLSNAIWIEYYFQSFTFIINSLPLFMLSPLLILYTSLFFLKSNWLSIVSRIFLFFAVFYLFYLLGDHYLWHQYSSAELKTLYYYPPIIYHLFYKGHSLLVIVTLPILLLENKKTKKYLQLNFSDWESIQISWIRNFLGFYWAINLLSFIGFLFYNFQFIGKLELVYFGLNLFLVIGIMYLCFHGIKSYALQTKHTLIHIPNPNNSPEKYNSSSLSHQEMKKIHEHLISLLNEEQLFLKPKLTLRELSDRMNISIQYLSQTINTIEQKSFYDLVNTYRVNYFKKLIKENKHLDFTILALALESGFNSKASFNRVFKIQTGLTPSQFIKQPS